MAFLSATFTLLIWQLRNLHYGVVGSASSRHLQLGAVQYLSWPDAFHAVAGGDYSSWAVMNYELVEHCFDDVSRNRYDVFLSPYKELR